MKGSLRALTVALLSTFTRIVGTDNTDPRAAPAVSALVQARAFRAWPFPEKLQSQATPTPQSAQQKNQAAAKRFGRCARRAIPAGESQAKANASRCPLQIGPFLQIGPCAMHGSARRAANHATTAAALSIFPDWSSPARGRMVSVACGEVQHGCETDRRRSPPG